jgi:hypothetical protein
MHVACDAEPAACGAEARRAHDRHHLSALEPVRSHDEPRLQMRVVGLPSEPVRDRHGHAAVRRAVERPDDDPGGGRRDEGLRRDGPEIDAAERQGLAADVIGKR